MTLIKLTSEIKTIKQKRKMIKIHPIEPASDSATPESQNETAYPKPTNAINTKNDMMK